MSIVWNEKDDSNLEAMDMIEKHGRSLIIGSNTEKGFLRFEVLDYKKASAFIYDLLNYDNKENDEIEEITGLKFTEIGYGDYMSNNTKDEIKVYLQSALDTLERD